MKLLELSNEQRRQLIDVDQAFDTWREADRQFRQSYRGTMRWHKSKGHEYLYRYVYHGALQTKQSLGARSPKTEKLKEEYANARMRLRQRVKRSEARLRTMAPVNRALKLNRVPKTETKILRALDRESLLGGPLYIVGTNALFAYEIMAGVLFSSDLTATRDVDLLWDARRRLTLVLSDVAEKGVMGVLRSVDESFRPTGPRSFRAQNDEGYVVDLIRPQEIDIRRPHAEKMGAASDDLFAVGIDGLRWLVNAPKIEQTVIGYDGMPLRLACIDPRAFALHKLWVSRRDDRDPLQKPRDAAAAVAVAAICTTYLGLKLDGKELSALPKELRQLAGELKKSAQSWTEENGHILPEA